VLVGGLACSIQKGADPWLEKPDTTAYVFVRDMGVDSQRERIYQSLPAMGLVYGIGRYVLGIDKVSKN
jgi:hypothetical protein